jgi:hypothetical protein
MLKLEFPLRTPTSSSSQPILVQPSAADATVAELDSFRALLAELHALDDLDPYGQKTGTFGEFWSEAINELSAILDAYRGDLPTDAARRRYYRSNQWEDTSLEEVFNPYFEIPHPFPLAKRLGYTTWVVPKAVFLRAYAATYNDDEQKKNLLALSDYYDGLEISPPVPEPYAHLEAWSARRELAVRQMVAIFKACPSMPARHARYFVSKDLAELAQGRVGHLYEREVRADYPPHLVPENGSRGWVFTLGLVHVVMARIAENAGKFDLAADHRRLINTYYIDHDDELELELDGPGEEKLYVTDVYSTPRNEAVAAIVEHSATVLPGSVDIRLDAECRYSREDNELEYRLFRYLDPERYANAPGESCILLGPHNALEATLHRAD